MKNKFLYLIALLLVAVPFLAFSSSSETREPPIPLKTALQMAERYVAEKKITLSGSYLASIWYSKFSNKKNNAWIVIWAPKADDVLDGELRVYVHDDGRIEYGGSA